MNPGDSTAAIAGAAGDFVDGAHVDVLIAGAGLVGLALATALARSGVSVAIADHNTIVAPMLGDGDDDWDHRVYAISPGSAAFLRSIGTWQHLPCERVQPIESMLVSGDRASKIEFCAYDIGERALAWIVEERALRAALVRLARAAGVPVLAPREFASIAWSPEQAVLHFADGGSIAASLVVGADGLRSWVRQAAGIAATPKSYGQTGVVANFASERAHHGRARQWFRTDGGILAWLPLPGRRISIVWAAPEAQARDLLQLDPVALAARVAEAGGHALGALRCITPAAGFPLSYLSLPNTIAHRLALVGDAAHGVHPLAGQGVNLGFGDAETLAAVLMSRGPIVDVATPFLLDRYARRRAEPVRAMQFVTDGLARLFGSTAPWVRTARNAGLSAVDRIPFAKRLLANAALG